MALRVLLLRKKLTDQQTALRALEQAAEGFSAREEELAVEVELAGCFLAFPGDVVRLRLEALGIDGEYRVAEAENRASPETGEVSTLTLRERI